MAQAFAPTVIIKVLCSAYFSRHGLKLATRQLSIAGHNNAPPDDEIASEMSMSDYYRLDAIKDTADKDWTVFIILSQGGKYSHSQHLQRLISNLFAERNASSASRLSELIIIADESFFSKKNLTDVVMKFNTAAGANCSAFPYYIFVHDQPNHVSVPKHRILSTAEAEALLAREHIVRSDLPTIFTTDIAVIWIAGKVGDIIEITRNSETAGRSIYYRRVELGDIAQFAPIRPKKKK